MVLKGVLQTHQRQQQVRWGEGQQEAGCLLLSQVFSIFPIYLVSSRYSV